MIESLFIPNLHITLAQAGFGEVDGDALVKGFMQVIEQHHGRIPQGALAQLPGAAGLFFQQMQSLPIEERFARYVAGVEQFTGQQMPAEMALACSAYSARVSMPHTSPPALMSAISASCCPIRALDSHRVWMTIR
ncbi:Uncharacterised protein [Klebsiella pneumoniae subsp. ozaenae]|uniref:Uncharacterized protein n=1 Tax=Klebsiella pneumoniae subsp. ozaenae TaxID=574 RepID=A0A377YST5_KLEPO|nr:Uncharacterised protein [Klebsiella pneumoniae subsp. ozaenae]